MVLTRRACEPATMRAEDEFVAALEAVDHVTVDADDDRMTMTGDDGLRLAFRAYDADELLVGTWDIVNVSTGDSIDSVLLGTEPTVTFESDGNVTLETGCNTAGSSWELDGDELTIEPMRVTMKACVEPDGVMEQEAALVQALEAADRVEIAPGELTILDSEGRITLEAQGAEATSTTTGSGRHGQWPKRRVRATTATPMPAVAEAKVQLAAGGAGATRATKAPIASSWSTATRTATIRAVSSLNTSRRPNRSAVAGSTVDARIGLPSTTARMTSLRWRGSGWRACPPRSSA